MTEQRPVTLATATQHRPHIGAFVLETLTLGMYGEPKHTLREYVQNSFDAIRAARQLGYLKTPGRVTVALIPDRITVLDNGLGVRADQAWSTLTSIGASKKERQYDAGFRGIGRLAGMAYCDELIFRTSFPGEPIVTTVRFNSREILRAMDPDTPQTIDLAVLLSRYVSIEHEEARARQDEHFFEVTMQGLREAPATLVDADEVRVYLQENLPLPYAPTWDRRVEVENAYHAFFDEPMESVAVFFEARGQNEQIFKPYSDTVRIASGPARLATLDVDTIQHEELRYWGWFGTLDKPGAVADRATQGLRIRVRNIQVGGPDLVSAMFADVKPSYDRLNAWYVGEIHIDPTRVIPNARRDGFEEDARWLEIRDSLTFDFLGTLAREAYDRSKTKRLEAQRIIEDVQKLLATHRALMINPRATYDQIVGLMSAAKTARRNVVRALGAADEADALARENEGEEAGQSVADLLREHLSAIEEVESSARLMVGKFTGTEEQLASLRARIREEVVREVMAILKHLVTLDVAQQVKQELERTAGVA